MILETVFNLIKKVLLFIINLLPTTNINLPDGFVEWFRDTLSFVGYFVPVGDIFLMLGIWFAITNFNIIWKIITRIWDALPFT
ncbi:hypothetical protein [Tissierella sp.]|uniref:hypothetical protein n=1 Tax=Tissierella sp. TaxID=41274 RepID=UPI003053F346